MYSGKPLSSGKCEDFVNLGNRPSVRDQDEVHFGNPGRPHPLSFPTWLPSGSRGGLQSQQRLSRSARLPGKQVYGVHHRGRRMRRWRLLQAVGHVHLGARRRRLMGRLPSRSGRTMRAVHELPGEKDWLYFECCQSDVRIVACRARRALVRPHGVECSLGSFNPTTIATTPRPNPREKPRYESTSAPLSGAPNATRSPPKSTAKK